MLVCSLLLTIFMLAQPNSARCEVHALIAAFDLYGKGVQRLQGAVADANDLADVLKKRNVRDVVVLTDPRATVADFRRRWNEIGARAQTGDLIILSFSGHGIRIPETRMPKRTPDGYDKGFLFPTYEQDRRPDELLRDEDLYDLFKATAARGLRILFVVDACHAGTGIRAADVRRGGGTFRFSNFDVRADAPEVKPPQTPPGPRPPIPSVAVITAQLPQKTIQEYQIDGKMRGALSFAVARALEGGADPNRSGIITLRNLWEFTANAVRTRSENQQAPILFARDDDGPMPIIADVPSTAEASWPEIPRVAIYSLDQTTELNNATFVTDRFAADLIWDPKRRQLLDAPGDILASDIDEQHLQDAVDARRLLLLIRKASEKSGNLKVSLRRADSADDGNPDRFYIDQTLLRYQVEEGSLPSLTVLNISAGGQVQFLFPRNEAEERAVNSRLPAFRVQPPFGADFSIFIRSDALLGLRPLFASQGNELPARSVEEFLSQALKGRRFRIGIQGLYTCAALKENGQCDSMLSSSP
jgi:hypothetical protein